MGLFVIMAGMHMVGFGLIGAAVLLGYTLPWETKWVKSIWLGGAAMGARIWTTAGAPIGYRDTA